MTCGSLDTVSFLHNIIIYLVIYVFLAIHVVLVCCFIIWMLVKPVLHNYVSRNCLMWWTQNLKPGVHPGQEIYFYME